MALRGTLTHRKTRRLATALGIDPCFALGIEEAIWHVTAEQAPPGDIGRLSDYDIADEIFYGGDPAILIRALVAAGLLDEHSEHRLIVHDWHVHSDDATDNKLSRAGWRYANGELPRMRRLSKEERVRALTQYSQPCESVRTECHSDAQYRTESHFQSRNQSPEPEPGPVSKDVSPVAPTKSKRSTRLPEGFAVSEKHRIFARKNGLPDPDTEIDHFRDYFSAKAGKDGLCLDWDARFRNWLRIAAQFQSRPRHERNHPVEPQPVQPQEDPESAEARRQFFLAKAREKQAKGERLAPYEEEMCRILESDRRPPDTGAADGAMAASSA